LTKTSARGGTWTRDSSVFSRVLSQA